MNTRVAWWVTVAVVGLMAVFFLYPMAVMVRQALQGSRGQWSLEWLSMVVTNPQYVKGMANSFGLGLGATVVAFMIAVPLALVVHRYEFPLKSVLKVGVLAPMILPPFVGAVGIKQVLGVNGALNAGMIGLGWMSEREPMDWLAEWRWLGMVWMIGMNLYPLIYLNLLGALSKMDPAMEQVAECLGSSPWRRFWRVTLPMLKPGLFAGGALVFVWAFTELGVPLVFDYSQVVSVQIFDGLKSMDRDPQPYALTLIVLGVSSVVYGLARRVVGVETEVGQARPKGRIEARRLKGWKKWGSMTGGILFVGVVSLPHVGVILLSVSECWYGTVVPGEWTLRHYVEALGNGLVIPSIQNSLRYAAGAVGFAMVVGVSAAWVIERSGLRVRQALDVLVMMPLAIPGLVLAFGYYGLMQEGKAYHWMLGEGGDPWLILVVAYGVRRLPYVVRFASAGLQMSPVVYEQAARNLGGRRWRVFGKITIPLMGAHLWAGAILTFAFCMMEVSDSLILAQQSTHFPITKAIYSLVSSLGNGVEKAAALGVWAMVFLSVAMLAAAGRKSG